MAAPNGALLEAALGYQAAALSVLPARLGEKRAAVPSWKPYQSRLPTQAEVEAWFQNGQDALCIVAGKASGNLEILDFDLGGELYEAWRERVAAAAPDLPGRLVVETSPSGGRHVAYRCETPVCGNLKLAHRKRYVPSGEPWVSAGKQHVPRREKDGRWAVILTLIETRGEGGLFLCAPSPGYTLAQGTFTALPVFTEAEREILLEAAWSLNEYVPEPVGCDVPREASTAPASGDRPGDDFNARGDIRALLVKHGWTLAKGGENEYWRRPGKNYGWSATLKGRVFYVFSSSAAPFEPNRAYSPFGVYTLLEHEGDHSRAATALRGEGFGGEPSTQGVDLSGFKVGASAAPEKAGAGTGPKTLRELMATYPSLRPPVIEGLLREGETLNVIAPSKLGKSWLVIDLALAIATGRDWLGMPCVQGDVLIIDNELHAETSANRIPKVAEARGIDVGTVADRVHVENLRGRLQDLLALGPYFRKFPPGRFKVVILDAFYRFLPMKADENDNGTMANLYNYLDAFADHLKCSFVLIHHTSKGSQSLKDVTDVGAGAGSMGRATDTHLILRRHEESDAVVLEAAVRSWPPIAPRCLRWAFPVWLPADDLDPMQLRQEGKRRAPKAEEGEAEPSGPEWTRQSFVETFLAAEPKSLARILDDAEQAGISSRRVQRYLEVAEEEGRVFRWNLGQKRTGYATRPQPGEPEENVEPTPSKREEVERLLRTEPEMPAAEVAARCGVSDRYVRRIREEQGGGDAQ